MVFFLGTHRPNWLWQLDVPLFVSHNTLKGRKSFGHALAPWGLDSGGFTELSQHGKWRSGPAEWVDHVARYQSEIGNLEWAAPQDWMCEPWIIEKTGLSVREHQELTVQNYLDLRGKGPFIPVLQGWEIHDYDVCIELYEQAGVDLAAEPVVGVGSVCRRQSTSEIGWIMRGLNERGINPHGFGVKKDGIARYGKYLASADSMAWSFQGRRKRLNGCTHKARNCANCMDWAMVWRESVIESVEASDRLEEQLSFEVAA